MYKYLPIAENLQEMMVMLKSLPAYTLVFDCRSNLVDMNQPAQQLFRVNNVQEFNDRRDEIFPTQDYIKTIIRELKRGKTVRNAKTLLRYVDSSQVIVELCACMINGQHDFFLFQLFEISLLNNFNLGSFTSYVDNNIKKEEDTETTNWITNSKNILVSTKKNKTKERLRKRVIEYDSLKMGESKYRKLTKIETIVSNLMALNLSVSQIANATNKTNVYIHTIVRRLEEKQKLNFRKEMSPNLIEMNEYRKQLG